MTSSYDLLYQLSDLGGMITTDGKKLSVTFRTPPKDTGRVSEIKRELAKRKAEVITCLKELGGTLYTGPETATTIELTGGLTPNAPGFDLTGLMASAYTQTWGF
jgi:hypothetical protein